MPGAGYQLCTRYTNSPGTCETPPNPQACLSSRDSWVDHSLCHVTGTVSVSQMQVGWTTPLNVEGVSWTEPEQLGGRQLASVEQIRSSATLLDMLRGALSDTVQL